MIYRTIQHNMKKHLIILMALCLSVTVSGQGRLRDYGIKPGIFKTGENNAITDVRGVKVGHVTLEKGEDMHTGVTAIIPHEGNLFKKKCPAGVFVGNGFGKLAGTTQVMELGNIESPIILTNTLNVAEGIAGVVKYTISQKGNEDVQSVNAVVGETNDGELNNIRARYVTPDHVIKAIKNAKSGPVEEGAVGAGTGTVCFGFKGGIGTSSRVLPESLGGYTVGVLVQSNYGGALEIEGVPVGVNLGRYAFKSAIEKEDPNPDGSCMIVVITDAPVDSRNLQRIAKRAFMGLAKTGGIASNGSGDYVIAVSVNKDNLIDSQTDYYMPTLLHNDSMSALFAATIEATSEALWNSLFAGKDVKGYKGNVVKALPVDKVVEMMKKGILE